MKTELVTSLKRKATDIIDSLSKTKETILITEHGRPAAYLVDTVTFENMESRLKILEGIARGENDIRAERVLSLREMKVKFKKWQK